jgi:outer membrane lipopolysaccharide assembly protein LptE/RlpB
MRRPARTITALVLALGLCACGYTLRGQRADPSSAGAPDRSIRLLEVNQPTIYTDLVYILRSQLRDEINARGMAVWKDSGQADFGLILDVVSFTVNAYGQSRSENLLYTAYMSMVFQLVDGQTHQQVWTSGQISYSERYTNVNEEEAVRELAASIIRRGTDRMQMFFHRPTAPGSEPQP